MCARTSRHGVNKAMTGLRPKRDARARRFGAPLLLVTFMAMAAEEWRKLVAEVSNAFGGKRPHPNRR